jgi:sterol 3beta-glucosyltransferase
MRFVILTGGSRGDVEPYLALGRGLQQAGHDVTIATHRNFEDMVVGHGIGFAPVTNPSPDLVESARWKALQQSESDLGRFLWQFLRVMAIARPLVEGMLDGFWRATRDADVIVSSLSGIAGPQLAAARGIPHVWALLQPMSPTREHAHFMTPQRLRLTPGLNYRTHVIAEYVYWRLFRTAVNSWVARIPGPPAVTKPRPGELFGGDAGPILYGISGRVLPRPADWPDNITLCGYWFPSLADGQRLPDDVAAFLDDGPPPVYIHVARIGTRSPEAAAAMAVDALRATGQRGLLSTDGDARLDGLPGSVMSIGSVPFELLFPRLGAVVHHGGAGTTALAMRAGIPALGVPSFFDQTLWSRRVAALGAGPPAIPARRLNTARLSAAIERMTADRTMRARARELGGHIRPEQGVRQAVERLGALAGERSGETR